MTPHPRLSVASIDLVKRFEGLRHTGARLAGGGWTIGYGHTASARDGAFVTADQAEILLTYDLDRVARAIDPLIYTPLNDNQFNALVAFAFNIGTEAFRTSGVLKRVNEGALLQAASAIELWRRAPFEGEMLVVDGLVRRRAAEKLLFLTPPDGFRPVPTPVVRAAFDGPVTERRAEVRSVPTDLRVPLEGDRAVAERSVEDAAQDVTARLRQLYPDADPEPIVAALNPQPPAPPVETSPAETEEPLEEPPPPPFATVPAAAPVQRLFEVPQRPASFEVDAPPAPHRLDEPAAAFGRRRGIGLPRAVRALGPAHLPLAIGALGAVLFVGALMAMIFGAATIIHLVVGLVGVAMMTPAAMRILIRLFGERPASP